MLGLDSVDPRFGEGRARGGTVSSAAKVAAHQHYLPRRVPNLRRYVKGPCAGAVDDAVTAAGKAAEKLTD